MSKAQQIQRMLERRILYGDYLLQELPAERELAKEVGVSRMTARKAVQSLVQRGVLHRQPNGRLTVTRNGQATELRLAFMVPSLSSMNVERWRLALEKTAARFGGTIRTILYVHWEDPVLLDALDGFDGVFISPSSERIPDRVIDRLRAAGRSIVIVGQDMTSLGLPCVESFPPVFVQRLLDKLAELGHRRIDCFNTQTVDPAISGRIEQWNLWRAVHRMSGELLGHPIQPYEQPLEAAYEQMGQLLDENRITSTALLCTTAPAAIGAMRAMRDRGIHVGRDISVCVVNDEGIARYLSPSLTALETPDLEPYLAVCMDWLRNPRQSWVGPLLLQPVSIPLFVGESTGPAPAGSDEQANGEHRLAVPVMA